MTIHIINPNSLETVTQGIDGAVAGMRAVSPVPITTHTLSEGPPGIETAEHIQAVVAPLTEKAKSLAPDATAFVIACYSDPGVPALRAATDVPVIGIGEAAVLTALQQGGSFGTISIQPGSIPRHMAALAAMGVQERCAGDLALSLSVRDLSDQDRTADRLRRVGATLRDQYKAQSLILGCAGMAGYRTALEQDLGLPVIDPCQAATAMAIGAYALAQGQKEPKT